MTDLNSGVDITCVVSAGSYRVSPEAQKRYWALLDKINKGHMPKFATGGYVQKPAVGRIVHYTHAALVGDNGEGFPEIDLVTHAAMILSVGEGYNAYLHIHPAMTRLKVLGSVDKYTVNCVEPPLTRNHFDTGTPFSETPKPGHWSWPPRA